MPAVTVELAPSRVPVAPVPVALAPDTLESVLIAPELATPDSLTGVLVPLPLDPVIIAPELVGIVPVAPDSVPVVEAPVALDPPSVARLELTDAEFTVLVEASDGLTLEVQPGACREVVMVEGPGINDPDPVPDPEDDPLLLEELIVTDPLLAIESLLDPNLPEECVVDVPAVVKLLVASPSP